MKSKESCLEYCKDIHLISALFYLFFQQLSSNSHISNSLEENRYNFKKEIFLKILLSFIKFIIFLSFSYRGFGRSSTKFHPG